MFLNFLFLLFSANVSLYTLDRLVSRSGMPAGNFTVWNMGFSQTDRCHQTSRVVAETTVSIRFLAKPAPVNMCQGPCSLTWNQLSWVCICFLFWKNFSLMFYFFRKIIYWLSKSNRMKIGIIHVSLNHF